MASRLFVTAPEPMMSMGPLATNFGEILIKMQTFSFKKCFWKCTVVCIMSAILSRPRCVKSHDHSSGSVNFPSPSWWTRFPFVPLMPTASESRSLWQRHDALSANTNRIWCDARKPPRKTWLKWTYYKHHVLYAKSSHTEWDMSGLKSSHTYARVKLKCAQNE